MPHIEVLPMDMVTAIGRLLSDQHLRSMFEESPERVAEQLGIADDDREMFVALDPCQLNGQADALLSKRWHEVRRLVPQTIDDLGTEAVDVFRYYATNDWPQGHRRHPLDAYRFLQFLQTNQILSPCKSEVKRMRRLSN